MGSSSKEVEPFADPRERRGEEAASASARPTAPGLSPPVPPRRGAPAVYRPAMSLPSVQSAFRAPELPPLPARPSGAADPFAEHESAFHAPRVSEATPRGQGAESREQLGALKDEPAKREQSPAALPGEAARTAAAEARVAQLEGELLAMEEERKDLSRALAEAEAELSRLTGELKHERDSRGALAEEFVGMREALSLAQDRVGALEAERAEMEGALEAVREHYQASLAELESTGEQLRVSLRERQFAEAERAGLSARVAHLEAARAESEGEGSSLEESQAELASLRESLALSENEAVQLRDRMEADAAALSEAAEQAEAQVAALQAELRTVDADRQDLARALAEVEAEELGAESRAREAGDEAERLRQRVKMLEGELEDSRGKGGPAPEEVLAERDQLKADVAAMKRKLMVAETALEAAASSKMRLAKLEAQLARLRGAQ